MKLEQLFENNNKLITPTKFKNYYIEVCPPEYEFIGEWGSDDVFCNATSDTDGYKNTVQMYLHGNELADKVLNLIIDGKDDWYIPAIDELVHVIKSKMFSVSKSYYFWSSTEYDMHTSWRQYNHNSFVSKKGSTYDICVVRRVYGNPV